MKKIEKKLPPITIKGVGKRGKNPYIEHNPQDTTHQKRSGFFREAKDRFRELISEQPVTVKAKSSKTGRTITHRFRDPKSAAEHYHRWLKSGKLKNIQLVSEKAESYDLPVEMLKEVYSRGLNDWDNSKPFTQDQWAFARLNSFLEGGRAFELDEDLISEAKGFKITAKTPNKSLGRLARRKDSLGRQAKAELNKRLKARESSKYANKGAASKKFQNVITGKTQLSPIATKKLIATLGINPKSAVAKSLNAVAKKTTEKKKIEKKVAKEVQKKLESSELKKQLRDQEKQRKKLEAERLENQRLEAKARKARDREDAKAKAEAERIANLVKTHIQPVVDKIEAKLPTTTPLVSVTSKPKKMVHRPDVGRLPPPKKKGLMASVLKFLGKKQKQTGPREISQYSDDEFNELINRVKRMD
jgi:hypothetical protein